MKILLQSRAAPSIAADILVFPSFGRPTVQSAFRELDAATSGLLATEAKRRRFRGGAEQEMLLHMGGSTSSRYVILVGCEGLAPVAAWHRVADLCVKRIAELRAGRAAVFLGDRASPDSVEAVTEGLILARYRFDRFRSKPEIASPLRVTLSVGQIDASLRRALEEAQITAEATCFARDLANLPASVLTPHELGEEARRLAGSALSVKVRGRREIERLGMGALLGVAQGSVQEPAFIELKYRPKGPAKRHVALVGKGITFDSGGLSLKPAASMETQKRDMAGAAVVLGTMRATAALGLPLNVSGFIPAAENMPSGSAMRPGDVLRAYNGRTIEVLNTDAEGRLALADALSYAASTRPDLMIDFATLTGAVRMALGSRYAAILGTDRSLVRDCINAGLEVGENLWELPLADEYRKDIDSRIADLKNTGDGQAGTIIGGLFLREFTGDIPWAHIDFSSVVMSEGHACHPKGASGFGVRTMVRFLRRLAGVA